MTLIVLAAWGQIAMATELAPMRPGEIAHRLDRLAHTGRVLYVAAHPDDENSRLLGYIANARHLTVTYLSLTRGEGGQNLIGTEQGDLLGLLRTQELFGARRIDGALQRFGALRDFGYSKNAKETLAEWGHERALAGVVLAIRSFQPDIVITRFDEHSPDHGHHTASAILAREAFSAAADPNRFPEQLRGAVKPWQADRLLQNPWLGQAQPADALKLDVGGYDPRLGMSYGELAALSRSQHKSQGFGVVGERGPAIESFVPVAGTVPQKDPFEGFDGGWERFGTPAAALVQALGKARAALDRDAPEKALPFLLDAHAALALLPEEPRTRDARAALGELLTAVTGVFARATADQPVAVPGHPSTVKVEVLLRRPAAVLLDRLVFPGSASLDVKAVLRTNEKLEFSGVTALPAGGDFSSPSWFAEPCDAAAPQSCAAEMLYKEAAGRSPVEVQAEFRFDGRSVKLALPVQYVWTDRVLGERTRLVLRAPPATVTPERKAVLAPNGRAGRVTLRVRGWVTSLDAVVRLPAPEGWVVRPGQLRVSLPAPGDETVVHFDVRPAPGAAARTLVPEMLVGDKTFSFAGQTIDHPHVPVQSVFQKAAVRVVPLSVQLPSTPVGYVMGSGDTVMDDLAQIGVKVQLIDDQMLRTADLRRFSAIVTGIRAYNTRPALRAAHGRLMAYVKNGGNLIVQYNTHDRWSRIDFDIAPYPLRIGRARVTDQKARMTPLEPAHPLLNRPNRIGPADFEGWVQERGLFFAQSWGSDFHPLFEIADPGEPPEAGSLLVARAGRGHFIYTGLSFFRQLPEGVPGAYRLFTNLLSIGNSR